MIRSLTAILPILVPLATVSAQKTVQVVTPVRAVLEHRTGLPGTLVPEARLELKARTTGFLAEIPVDHGSEVHRGDLLAALDIPDLIANRNRAAAALAAAEAAIGDAQAALRVAGTAVEQARGEVSVCEADIRLTRTQAERTGKLVEQRGATPMALEEAQAKVDRASARGRVAEAALAASTAKVSAAEAGLVSARAGTDLQAAELALVETRIAFARMSCPFEKAVVTRRQLDPGALVLANETVILDLARVDKLRAEFHVPERDAVHVRVGTPVDLRFDALDGATLQTRVTRTNRSLSRARVMTVQVDLDAGEGRLLPGMFVYADLLLGSQQDALTVPAAAVRTTGGKHYLFVVRDGRAHKTPVELGKDNGIRVQIRSGLTGDEQVVIAGSPEDGERVRIAEAGQ